MLNILTDFAKQKEGEIQIEYDRWIQRKRDSLLHALKQSKQQALLKERFWQNGDSALTE